MTHPSINSRVGITLLCCTFVVFVNHAHAWQSDNGNGTFTNPVLYADYADPDIIRVTNDFYMVSTTFVDNPGINVLHSKDLVNWELVSHCATNLDGGNTYNLIGGTAYRQGFWASSIRYYNGTFYVVANPTFANSRIYYTTNAAGPWQYYQLNQVVYDPGFFIDADGTGYIVYGYSPQQSIATLNASYSQIVAVSNNVVNSGGEGSHMVKRGNYYYLFSANPGVWPYQLRCSRSTNIFGPWETGHICLTATTGGHQGAIVDIDDSDHWFGFVHQDSGAAGRLPRIGPVFWENNWPVFGTSTARDQIAASYTKPVAGQPVKVPATSDDFSSSALGLQWQWNHNPDNTRWSLSERPGFLRLRPSQATNLWSARNTLTQKGQGPQSQGIVKFDVSNLKSGDIAGFGTLGTVNGQVFITADSGGHKTLGMTVDDRQHSTTNYAAGYLFYGTNLYLRTDLNFQSNLGTCSYSADGITWTRLGVDFPLAYDISVGTFQGEKFAIFCYNTTTSSSTGYVDVDSFTFNQTFAPVSLQRGRARLNVARTTFVADNGQLLRGPYGSTEGNSSAQAPNIASMKSLGFNAVHLYAEVFDLRYPTNGSQAPGYSLNNVDTLVAATRTNGLYLIITIGNGANNGNYNRAYITNFWNLYGARYANETHVLYEIQNEPVAWGPPYSAANATPPGGLDMEVAAYNAIRAVAPNTPVLLFTYAVFGGTGGADAAMTDIHAFNTSVFGNQSAVWTNEVVAFHGYNGWSGTRDAVTALLGDGYPCMMTEYGTGAWGSTHGGLDAEMTSELERLNVSWLGFQYVPPSGVSDNVSLPDVYSNIVVNSGLSWSPDYGNFPPVRGPYGNGGQPRTIPASYNNDFLSGTPMRIQAEDFDTGGEGVAYHELTTTNLGGQYRASEAVDIEVNTDTGGGYDVTGMAGGEWLEYTIWVQVAGYYNLSLRYATASNSCAVQVTGNGHDRTGSWMLPSTGGATTWATATKPVLLEFGRQKMRLTILNGGFNLNWMELTPASTGFIPNGTYKFLNAATGLVPTGVASNNTVMADSYAGSTYQQWALQHIGGGQYKITSVANNNSSWNVNNKALGMSGWGTGGNQCFIIAPTRGSFYSLLPVGNGVPVETSTSNPNTIDENSAYSGGANQQWAIAAPSAPMFPIGLTVTPLSTTQVTLTWSAVAGATSYNLKRAISSGGPYTTFATGITVTSYTDTVPVGMKYYYVVTAVSGGSESPNSAETIAGVPYPWKTQDIGTVNLNGSANLSNGVFTVTGSGDDIWNAADAFRYVYVTVTGDCTMIARVTSVQNIDGWSKAGVMIRASLDPGAMNTFIAVTPGNGITWQYRTSTGGSSGNGATGGLTAPYWVKLVRSGNTFAGYRSPDGVTWTQVGSTQTFTIASTAYVGLAVTSHNNSSLCPATFDNVTAPGWTNPSPPQPPASLTATVTNWSVNLSWSAASTALSYNVKRAAAYGGPYALLANLTTTNFTDTAVANGTNYFYVVSALNAGGESANSVQAIVTAQIFAPTGLSAAPVSATQISLVWNSFTNATSYKIKRSPASGGPYTTIASGVTATSFSDTMPVGMRYYYVVSAISGGVETPNSSETAINLPFPWLTQDINTAGLTGSAVYANGVFTATGAGADIWGASDAFRYVYVAVTGDCTMTARVTSVQNTDPWSKAGIMLRESLNAGAANAFIAVTPGNGVTWQYRTGTGGNSANNNTTGLSAPYWVRLVRSVNSYTGYLSPDGVTWTQLGTQTFTMASTVCIGLAVTSHNSSSLSTATFDNVTGPGWLNAAPPATPASLTATAGNGLAVLTWPASSAATSYNLKRALTNGGPYAIVTNVTATSYTDTGLIKGADYHYVVSALNTAGESADSTPAGLTAQVLAPAGLSATTVSVSQISLIWNAYSNTATYNLKRSTTNGGTYGVIATGLTATNYLDGGLAGGTPYYYVVSAVVGGNETTNSAQATATTLSPTLGSLLHHYSFLETSGANVADSVGGPVWTGTLPNGGAFSAGQLTLSSNSSQYVLLPAGIMSPLSNFTIEVWAKLNSVANGVRLFDFGNSTGNYMFLTPQSSSTSKLRFGILTPGNAEQDINGSSALSAGGWNHVVVTLNGSRGMVYVNGVAVGTNSTMTNFPSGMGGTTNNWLGRSEFSSTTYLDGVLDEFRIYNKALSPAEITATYALGPDQTLSTSSPSINLGTTDTSLTLSWPVESAGFTLQSCTNLVLGGWVNVTSPVPQIVGNQWQVALPPPGNTNPMFYRLVK